jgi:cytoplasmic iron level regulating protein YaaA (DUF328/UPF0246 family)
MLILLHSSKAMRSAPVASLRAPQLLDKAKELDGYLKTLTVAQLAKCMNLSTELAKKTKALIADWHADSKKQTAAIDAFIGDIYSGMQAPTMTAGERKYADEHLLILSGLYGLLRPLDGITPYRLEMGYRLPDEPFKNPVKFWGELIAKLLPPSGPILNLAAVEYSQTVTPYVDEARLIAPRFLTVSSKTGEPAFVTVHAKVARGAFARWMISNRISKASALLDFDEIGYRYVKKLSSSDAPVFVAKEFGGTGLSIRMQDA